MIISEQYIWDLLNQVPDPEVPAISIVELGVVRKVELMDDNVHITLTPTYSGCPALKAMEEEVRLRLLKDGIEKVDFKLVYKPAWTTDWLTDATKQKLKDYGIAPPEKLTMEDMLPYSRTTKALSCPFCDSNDTKITSQFGSTACKSLHFCNNCKQPFEHFKCH